MPKKAKESQTMGIRLSSLEQEMLEEHSKALNKNKSQVLREAFREWTIIQKNLEQREFILVPKTLLKTFLDNTTPEQITKIAKEQGVEFLAKMKGIMLKKNQEATITQLVKNMTDLFNLGLMNWFSTFEIILSKNKTKLQVYGLHSSGLHFTLFAKELFTFIFEEGFKYRLISFDQTLKENAVHLTFSS